MNEQGHLAAKVLCSSFPRIPPDGRFRKTNKQKPLSLYFTVKNRHKVQIFNQKALLTWV